MNYEVTIIFDHDSRVVSTPFFPVRDRPGLLSQLVTLLVLMLNLKNFHFFHKIFTGMHAHGCVILVACLPNHFFGTAAMYCINVRWTLYTIAVVKLNIHFSGCPVFSTVVDDGKNIL